MSHSSSTSPPSMLPLSLRDISQLDFNATGHPRHAAPTFGHPHTCSHCKDILIDRDVHNKDAPIHIRELPQEIYSPFELAYGLEQAINASREGCSLYAWVLNHVRSGASRLESDVRAARDSLVNHVKFSLVFDRDQVDCEPLVEATLENGSIIHLEPMKRSTLRLYSREDSPASQSVTARPPETDRLSAKSLQFAKACLETCLHYHQQCRTKWLRGGDSSLKRWLRYEGDVVLPPEVIAAEDLPTRLLELDGADPPSFKLVEVQNLSTIEKDRIAKAGFVTLSYCWGPAGNPIQLTAATYDVLRNGMSASSLPATIQDSMIFTARIGLRYLWVDALCILQDSPKDKQLEIARMASYYNANTLTLCAASAPSCAHGLGADANEASSTIGPFQLQYSINGDKGTVLLYSNTEEYKLPTTERGWTLQESLLSRRLLIFSYQLFWGCVTANAECEGYSSVLSKRPSRVFGGPESLVPGIFPMQALWDYPPYLQWQMGLNEFVSRKLGVESDKLLAISAFASFIHNMFRARGATDFPSSSMIYLAGIFLLPAIMPFNASQLFWRPIDSQDCKRTSSYRAPSWSWASVEGPVKMNERIAMSGGVGSGSVSLDSYEVQLADPRAPYGAVEYAVLRLTGILQPLWSCHHEVCVVSNHLSLDNEGLNLLPDCQSDYELFRNAAGMERYSGIYLFLLQGCRMSQHTISRGARGIVIQIASNGATHTFKRVGTFALNRYIDKEKEKSQALDTLGQFDDTHDTIILV